MVNVVLVLQNASPEVVKVLAGNKCEVTNQQRAVDKERGLKVGVSQVIQAGVLVQIYISGPFVKTCMAVKVKILYSVECQSRVSVTGQSPSYQRDAHWPT